MERLGDRLMPRLAHRTRKRDRAESSGLPVGSANGHGIRSRSPMHVAGAALAGYSTFRAPNVSASRSARSPMVAA
jgi:hypothetical protein